MRLLGYVWVGLHCISVFESEKPKVEGVECDGYFDAEAHIIHVCAGVPVSRQREVLMHELMHLAYYHSQMDKVNEKHSEETVCTRLGPVIAEIINKNQWISAFIEDRVK